jgi:Flp pilus assembly protein TadG
MRRLLRDQNGGVLVETTIMISIVLVFVLGSVDFLFAFYQWNAAAKALEIGARIAAVSNPPASGLSCITTTCAGSDSLSTRVVSSSLHVGDTMPSFTVTCNDGGSGGCSCAGTCTGVSGYNSAALNTIVYGRGSAVCGDATNPYRTGMCDIFPRIQPANVRIVYAQTGLGYAGRSRGPVPTITLSLQNLTFQFFFLGGLLGFNNINIPALQTTITGEDLSSVAPT